MANDKEYLKKIISPINWESKETLNAPYQQGVESGSQAEDAPALKQIEADIKLSLPPYLNPPHSTPLFDVVSGSFRSGYIEGITQFLAEHHIDLSHLLIAPETLAQDSSLLGYLQGLRRQSPNILRKYPEVIKDGEKLLSIHRKPEPAWLQGINETPRQMRMQYVQGYRLGIVSGVARDFDVVVDSSEIPSDNPAYDAFMAGLQAQPRALPESLRAFKQKQYILLDEETEPFTDQLRLYEMADNRTYKAGLAVWLRSEGLDSNIASLIRYPETLMAFKAAYAGTPNPDYTDPYIIQFNRSARSRSKLLFKEYLSEPDDSYEMGLVGHNLGTDARQRKANSPKK